jgi:hypothetical protein
MGGAASDWRREPGISLSTELQLEAVRREAKHLGRIELLARYDSALVHAVALDHLLKQAMARVMELELREALSQPPAAAPLSVGS